MMDSFFLYFFIASIGVFIIYFIGISLAPYKPDPIKSEHFECGLPPSSQQPKRANFGFFVYAIMFVVVDMAGLFFTLFVYTETPHSYKIASLFALILAVGVTVAMKEHKYAENS
jgi:NADH-quinone oxidoreductase subunit A